MRGVERPALSAEFLVLAGHALARMNGTEIRFTSNGVEYTGRVEGERTLALAQLIQTRYPKDTLDVVLFGDDAGTNTAQRVHWVDRETNVVNDIPNVAMLVAMIDQIGRAHV